MSATSRDSQRLTSSAPNAPVTPETHTCDPGTRCCNTSPPSTASVDPLGIINALCHMALLRTKSLAVSGAYAHPLQARDALRSLVETN